MIVWLRETNDVVGLCIDSYYTCKPCLTELEQGSKVAETAMTPEIAAISEVVATLKQFRLRSCRLECRQELQSCSREGLSMKNDIRTVETAVEKAATPETAATPEMAAATMAEMASGFGLLCYLSLLVSKLTVTEEPLGSRGERKRGAKVLNSLLYPPFFYVELHCKKGGILSTLYLWANVGKNHRYSTLSMVNSKEITTRTQLETKT